MGLLDRVRIDGYRPFSKLAPYYACMDLGVILLDKRPNHQRALPNKLFDYMAHGVPLLVPEYPAMAAIVRGVPCGWTGREITSNTLRDVILEVRSSGDALRFGSQGRDRYLHEYAWENQESRFLDLVKSVVRTAARD